MSEKQYRKDLFELAHLKMEVLRSRRREGLSKIDPDPEVVTKGVYSPYFRSDNEPTEAEARPVRLDKNQVIWLQPHAAIMEEQGYRRVKVFEKPSSSDAAAIATLTALMSNVIKTPEHVRTLIPLFERWNEDISGKEPISHTETGFRDLEARDKILNEPQFQGVDEEATQLFPNREVEKYLEDVKVLLRYYRPSFDDLPRHEQIALIEHTCKHINEFKEALDKLRFVEYGTPEGDLTPAVKQAAEDVRVAELHEVLGLGNKRIGGIIGVPPSKTDLGKNDNSTVRQMGKRGREILEKAFGKEGWREIAEAMREEATEWESLSEEERWLKRLTITLMATTGGSLEECRKSVENRVAAQAAELGLSYEQNLRQWLKRESEASERLDNT